MTEQTRHKLKWYQFSLRTLLLMVTVFSVVMGLIGWKLQEIRKWQKLLAKLNRRPFVEWSYGKPIALHFMDPLPNFKLTDDDLAVVGEISSLRLLRISYAPNVTDNGIKHLSGLKELRGLMLSNTRITDDGLKHLKPLSNLTGLDLRGSNITNAGLAHLLALPKLSCLELAGTDVTDVGLPTLEKLPNIHFLVLGPTKPGLTDEALEKLRRAKPQWDISDQYERYPHLDVGKPHYPVTSPVCPPPQKSPPGKMRILVSEVTEPGIGALMICTVGLKQLDRLELQPEDIQAAGHRVLAALQDKLPRQAVDLFLAGMLSSETNMTTEKAASIKKLLDEGIGVEFLFGPGDGSAFRKSFRTGR